MSDHQFVVMWDCNGLEYVGDVTQAEQSRTWSALKGEPATVNIPNLMHLKLRAQLLGSDRAQYNMQRHYEIYFFNASDGITAEDIREMFEASPQTAADTIRGIGHCFHSDRVREDEVTIR